MTEPVRRSRVALALAGVAGGLFGAAVALCFGRLGVIALDRWFDAA